MIEWIVNQWLTWRTGKSKEQREWEAWYESNVNYRASSINRMFEGFKHVILVDTDKFMDPTEPLSWVPCAHARQYFWPARALGSNAVWRFERVMWDRWTNSWFINGLGDEDRIFVATNDDYDATMIALKYT